MPEPIIIDGHADAVTITLPQDFKLTRTDKGATIEVQADPGKPFETVLVRREGVEEFRSENNEGEGLLQTWNIRIGRDDTEK
ncbi:MAG TPA: hypothetical protein VFB82_02960 [Blastocatellia bacterium]|nr:hypothetical protein [Blastocatellia bacterium]